MNWPIEYLWLIPLGFIIGAYGTLIGAGGGFILVPILLICYPNESPEIITSISLAVVFFNAASGSIAYARMKRIDYRSAFAFTLASVPGAIFGAIATAYIPRRSFDVILGALMIAVSVYLYFQAPATGESADDAENGTANNHQARPLTLGMLISIVVGFISSLLGIGGGIIHVPAPLRILKFPVHVATATSHLILAITALTGTIVHIATGSFHHGWRRTVCLAIGVVIGAQIGAKLSTRIHGSLILRALALALIFVGIRLLMH